MVTAVFIISLSKNGSAFWTKVLLFIFCFCQVILSGCLQKQAWGSLLFCPSVCPSIYPTHCNANAGDTVFLGTLLFSKCIEMHVCTHTYTHTYAKSMHTYTHTCSCTRTVVHQIFLLFHNTHILIHFLP